MNLITYFFVFLKLTSFLFNYCGSIFDFIFTAHVVALSQTVLIQWQHDFLVSIYLSGMEMEL